MGANMSLNMAMLIGHPEGYLKHEERREFPVSFRISSVSTPKLLFPTRQAPVQAYS